MSTEEKELTKRIFPPRINFKRADSNLVQRVIRAEPLDTAKMKSLGINYASILGEENDVETELGNTSKPYSEVLQEIWDLKTREQEVQMEELKKRWEEVQRNSNDKPKSLIDQIKSNVTEYQGVITEEDFISWYGKKQEMGRVVDESKIDIEATKELQDWCKTELEKLNK
jgi:hypothetical protein